MICVVVMGFLMMNKAANPRFCDAITVKEAAAAVPGKAAAAAGPEKPPRGVFARRAVLLCGFVGLWACGLVACGFECKSISLC